MVQGAVGGGAAVRVAEGPAAADAVGHLEAVERDVAVGALAIAMPLEPAPTMRTLGPAVAVWAGGR
jgi:hypothetical protein